ncbi:TetR/AcrR family transcriptional regulator [Streptomyces sp. XD-27]|uniref:TetR/AcrR family transcriptional regulator n=1 Tax=Streptomyces sp. XD-27 TaxID=3062779 RepID=UPI0026F40E05|nr:TetR family transcriptional regulator [Streptomyces sp. XD-27]WKX71686.1 TetR family transcriptional regulator [Streptomyces sp. XD-27]
MSSDIPGLREQKKRETRRAISDHATRLFLQRGFDATTIADIAAASRVAKMTVTNYFPRKEDLALDHSEEFVAGPAAAVGERAPGESALAALRRAFLAGVERHDPVIGFSGPVFARMVAESPTLTARLRDLHEQREGALAEVLAAETGAGPDDIVPRVAAAQLGGVHRLLFAELQRRTLAGQSDDVIAAAVAEQGRIAFALLEPSLDDYAVREA